MAHIHFYAIVKTSNFRLIVLSVRGGVKGVFHSIHSGFDEQSIRF